MSAEYESAMEICSKLEEVRQELEWSSTGPGRRERIATAFMAARIARGEVGSFDPIEMIRDNLAKQSIAMADALIIALKEKPQ